MVEQGASVINTLSFRLAPRTMTVGLAHACSNNIANRTD